ncbi:MAG: hypothetical protein HYV28_19750 [Ignavibacteriales bacterium]|nr:hypothetical protein [Ignavibacteriales bacterium]
MASSRNRRNLEFIVNCLKGEPFSLVKFADKIAFFHFGKIHLPPGFPNSELKVGDFFLSVNSAMSIVTFNKSFSGYPPEEMAEINNNLFLDTVVEDAALLPGNTLWIKTNTGVEFETQWWNKSDYWHLSGTHSGRRAFSVRKLRIKDISDPDL